MLYSDDFDPDEQVTAEEGIASIIFEYDYLCGERPDITEEDCQELGRQILRYVLEQFRPDLFEPEGEPHPGA